MTNLQECRLGMYMSFRDFQTAYTAITNPLPNYSTNSATLLSTITQIQAVAEQQKISKKGVTETKNNLRKALVSQTADYSRKMGVFARFTNNATLAQEIKFSESKLKQVSDIAVRDYAQIVYDRAQANVANLAIYGITAATQTTLQNAINAYNAVIGKPGATRTESGRITKQLETLFKTADAALANMDAAVEIVRLSQPAFYDSYKNARRIPDNNGGSLAVKGLVTDAMNGLPIKGVILEFSLEGNNGLARSAKQALETVIKKTAEKGGFHIKNMVSGIYTVKVKKLGYPEYITTVAVVDGELTELNIQLSKN
jgi:hypothetical protein